MSSENRRLNLGVLKVVSEARNAHGLRLQDPARYNTYCAKRILCLKKSLKFTQKSKKAPPKPVTAELVTQDTR
jgi:RNA-binding signal recognition particle 68